MRKIPKIRNYKIILNFIKMKMKKQLILIQKKMHSRRIHIWLMWLSVYWLRQQLIRKVP